TTLKHLKKGLEKTLATYGHRALLANQHNGADWKALSHAVRVGMEAIELLTTHNITFPLKSRDRVLAIKKGEVEFALVEAEIEDLLVQITQLSLTTTLPDSIDQNFWAKWEKLQYDLTLYPSWIAHLKNLW